MIGPRPILLQRIVMWIVLLSTIVFSLYRLQPPDQDRDGFSTPRALDDLRFIASETRPVGSPHHQAVRNFIVERFEQLGFEVQLQNGHSPIPLVNILARKSGTSADHKAIALAAHYDSVRWGPGAGDDGAAVVALLEVGRVLSQSPHRDDLIFIITDGEEMGLWGARVFVDQHHPWLDDIAVILNFDARGSSGPSVMFETSPNNRWLIDLYAQLAPHPVCSALTADVYRLMPNGTDFTVWNQAGLKGLNFAFIGGLENYHQATDDIDHLDPRSLRHDGVQALALSRELLEMDLTSLPVSGDAIYFDIASLFVVHYPKSLSPVISIVAVLLAIVAIARMLKQESATAWRVAVSFAMLLINLLFIAGLARVIPIHLPMNMAILTYVLIAMISALCFIGGCYRCSIYDCFCAALIFWILATINPGPLPGGKYLFSWPLIGASVGGLWLTFPVLNNRCWVRFLGVSIAALPALLLWTPLMYLGFLALTLKFAWGLCLPVVLLVWLLAVQVGFPQMRKLDVPA